MTLFLLSIIFLVFVEVFLGIVVCRWRTGEIWYRLLAYGIYTYDSETGYKYFPNKILQRPSEPLESAPRRILFRDHRTGKEGFLFLDNVEKCAKESNLIFCLGGSTTAGGCETSHLYTYPAILDLLVRPHGFRCINGGVGGYKSIQELIHLRKRILPYQPYAVIIFSGYNDFESSVFNNPNRMNHDREKAKSTLNNPLYHPQSAAIPPNRFLYWLNRSALVYAFQQLYVSLTNQRRLETIPATRLPKLNDVSDYWIEVWKNNAKEMATLCHNEGVKCFFISTLSPVFKNASKQDKIQADRELNMSGRFDIFCKYLDMLEPITQEVCQETGATYLDLRADFEDYIEKFSCEEYTKKRFSLFVDRMHFTDEGNSVLANAIYNKIKPYLNK